MRGGHQRQLVQGQRPHPLGGQGECHRPSATVDQFGKQIAKRRDIHTAAERERSGKRLGGHRSGRDHERVERHSLTRSGHGDLGVGIDLRQRIPDHRPAALLSDYLRELVDARLATVERLGHRHGAIQELAIG